MLWDCLVIVIIMATTVSAATGANMYHYSLGDKFRVQTEIRDHFAHAFRSYMKHAFPLDELKPLSCKGTDHFGGYSVTLIDSLDTLAMLDMLPEFWDGVDYVTHHVHFNASTTVSVFETTIRVLGGLLSAHAMALQLRQDVLDIAHAPKCRNLFSEEVRDNLPDFMVRHPSNKRYKTVYKFQSKGAGRRSGGSLLMKYCSPYASNETWWDAARGYDGGLLRKAVEIADILLEAFDTPTGIPFNEIHLRDGVNRAKGHATCPAAAGTLLMEFGTLSAWTKNCTYLTVAKRALDGVWRFRGKNGLVGSMIDVLNGVWLDLESHSGASIDSFYEYLLKAYIHFGEASYYTMWTDAVRALHKYTLHSGWMLSSMVAGANEVGVIGESTGDYRFNSLQAFWPGMLVLGGDVTEALFTFEKMKCVADDWGLLPEYAMLSEFFSKAPPHQRSAMSQGYPLRPEYLESAYFLYEATQDDHFLEIGERYLQKIAKTRQNCGFAAVLNIHHFSFEDKMDSYVLAETFKYLHLMFQPSVSDIARDLDRYLTNVVDPQRETPPVWLQHYVSAHRRLGGMFSSSRFLRSVVYNTEAHPVSTSTQTQRIHSSCAHHDSSVFMSHNDLRLFDQTKSSSSDEADASPSSDYELFSTSCVANVSAFATRSPLRSSSLLVPMMCPMVNYMLDVAPFIHRMFHAKGAHCYAAVDGRLLGHRDRIPRAATRHQLMLHRLQQNGVANSVFVDGQEAQMKELGIVIHADRTLPWSKPLGLQLRYMVMTTPPESSRTDSTSSTASLHSHEIHVEYFYGGITVVPGFAKQIDALFLPHTRVVLSVAAPTTDSSDGTPPRIAAGAPRLLTSEAEFNPPLAGCTKEGGVLWSDVPLLQVVGDGCPSHERAQAWLTMSREDLKTVYSASGSPMLSTTASPPFGVIIRRGGCTFQEKTNFASDVLGASFVIISNTNNDDGFVVMGRSGDNASDVSSIPAFMVLQRDLDAYFRVSTPTDAQPSWASLRMKYRWIEGGGGVAAALEDTSLQLRRVTLHCATTAEAQFALQGIVATADPADALNLLLFPERLRPLLSLRGRHAAVLRVLVGNSTKAIADSLLHFPSAEVLHAPSLTFPRIRMGITRANCAPDATEEVEVTSGFRELRSTTGCAVSRGLRIRNFLERDSARYRSCNVEKSCTTATAHLLFSVDWQRDEPADDSPSRACRELYRCTPSTGGGEVLQWDHVWASSLPSPSPHRLRLEHFVHGAVDGLPLHWSAGYVRWLYLNVEPFLPLTDKDNVRNARAWADHYLDVTDAWIQRLEKDAAVQGIVAAFHAPLISEHPSPSDHAAIAPMAFLEVILFTDEASKMQFVRQESQMWLEEEILLSKVMYLERVLFLDAAASSTFLDLP